MAKIRLLFALIHTTLTLRFRPRLLADKGLLGVAAGSGKSGYAKHQKRTGSVAPATGLPRTYCRLQGVNLHRDERVRLLGSRSDAQSPIISCNRLPKDGKMGAVRRLFLRDGIGSPLRQAQGSLRAIGVALFICALPLTASAQGVYYRNEVRTTAGPIVTGAQVTICTSADTNSTTIPCPDKASIYADAADTVPAANPITADSNGNYSFYAPPGTYWVTVTGTGIQSQAFPLSIGGTGLVNAGAQYSLGQYSLPGTQATIGPTNISTDSTGSNLFIKGPAPWTDATSYGVRALAATNAIPAVAGITASITGGTNTATISTNTCALQTGGFCFEKGDGVDIYNAGAANGMTTPGAPTVAYDDASGPTGTGAGVAAPAGSTTFNYKILACDIGGGCTVVSTAGTTTTGNALGAHSFAITGMTRSNGTITFTVGSQPPISAGTVVHVDGCSGADNANGFCGWFKVATVTGTGFTATTGLDTRNGAATTSAGGGTVNYWTMNHVTWSAVTGAFRYVIQSDRQTPGTFVNIGMSWPVDPQNAGFTDGTLWFDDFGQTMMANSALSIPWYVPTNGTATNDLLRTTITAISGTTLTLAANAGNSVTAQTILFDDEPTAVAATTAAGTNPVLFPSVGGTYLFNSTTSISRASWMFSQGVQFNDTLAGSTVKLTSPITSAQSTSQFQGLPEPQISALGNPGIFIENAQYGGQIDGLAVYSGSNAIAVMQDGGGGSAGFVYNNVQFIGASSNSDYMSMGFVCRGALGAACMARFSGTTQLEAGSQAMTDQSFTPAGYLDDFDSISFEQIMGNARTLAINADGASTSSLSIDQYHWQGPTEPIITDNSGTNYIASITLGIKGSSIIDTGSNAAIFQDSSSTLYVDCGKGGCGTPASAVVAFTGLPVTSIRSYSQVTGQNINTLAFNYGLANDGTLNPIGGLPIGYSNLSVRGGIQVNNSYPIFINGAALAAPTCSVSAGGTVPVGTYTFIYLPVWWNGAEGVQSPPSASCSTTSGNQTITITRGSIPGNPMEWDLYVSNGAGYSVSNTFANPYSMATSSVTWSSHSFFNGGDNPATIPAGGPTMLMPGTQGVVAPTLIDTGLSPGASPICPNGTGGAFTTTGCTSGSGTVTDGAGTTTANELLASTTTAHTYNVVAALPTAAMPALTGDVTNPAGSLATTVGRVNGAALPTSTAFVGTNSGGQIVAATYPTLCTGNQFSQGLSSGSNNCTTPSGAGTVTYTTATTASASDNGKLVVMACTAACSYTLPATQPSTTWAIAFMTIGSTNATIALGGTDTFNGTTSAPVPIKFRTMFIGANTQTSTDYEGSAPLVAGTNVTLTPAANGLTVAASGGGGGGGGTVTYTTSTTASLSDNGKFVVMNCAAACTYTLPATQPSTTWSIRWTNISNGSIALGGTDTYNGSTSSPTSSGLYVAGTTIQISANSATSTDYIGDQPVVYKAPLSVTNSANTNYLAMGYPQTSVASRNTAIGTSNMATFNTASAPQMVVFSAWDSAAGVACTGNTTVTWSFSYVDQTGTTQSAANITETITTNGGATGGDAVKQSFVIPANLNNATGLQYSTTYGAGTGCTTNPSYAAAIKIVY